MRGNMFFEVKPERKIHQSIQVNHVLVPGCLAKNNAGGDPGVNRETYQLSVKNKII